MSNDVLLLCLLLVFTYLALCVNTLPAQRNWGDEAEDESDKEL